MHIRPFASDDAEFCCDVRREAFNRKFFDEIGPEAVTAGAEAYTPDNFIGMAAAAPIFIVEENDRRIGFFTFRRVDETTAELHLIYLDLKHLGKGVGSTCVRFIEDWIADRWKEVDTFFVDTVIPEYNGPFYRKMGFAPEGTVPCQFPGMTIPALRLSKRLKEHE